jgi:hypothetical protein
MMHTTSFFLIIDEDSGGDGFWNAGYKVENSPSINGVPLAQSPQILIACGILHNLCINKPVRHERMMHREQGIQIQPAY